MTNQAKIRQQALSELQQLSIQLLDNCQHPRQHVLGMFPSSTGGKEACLLCRKVRYQTVKNGPWQDWKNQGSK